MTKIERLEALLGQMPHGFSKQPCRCGHPSCKEFFLNFTGSDGRVDEAEADLVILLRELAPNLIKAVELLQHGCEFASPLPPEFVTKVEDLLKGLK